MSSLLQVIQGWFGEPKAPTPRVQLRQQYVLTSSGSRRSVPITVVRVPRPYWEEHGWQQKKGNYEGRFLTAYGSWLGRVTVSPGGRVEVFIQNPPPVLKDHPHWQCFEARGGGWFFVHPQSRLVDVSAGIIGVEKTIAEAYQKEI